ncbi:hypothetical protein M3Y98_00097200 [Aphelenchoides besseyi]|nr:hypothetical protein M3Y98_00097200 [Aphelenchoides besseyi]KAI6198574.1 hypothetical protein M3Y96_00533700 [Aphelenchoides besseyi]
MKTFGLILSICLLSQVDAFFFQPQQQSPTIFHQPPANYGSYAQRPPQVNAYDTEPPTTTTTTAAPLPPPPPPPPPGIACLPPQPQYVQAPPVQWPTLPPPPAIQFPTLPPPQPIQFPTLPPPPPPPKLPTLAELFPPPPQPQYQQNGYATAPPAYSGAHNSYQEHPAAPANAGIAPPPPPPIPKTEVHRPAVEASGY